MLLRVEGMGTINVVGHDGLPIAITQVHWVPEMHTRLLSVSHLTRMGANVTFLQHTCQVKRAWKLLMQGAITVTSHIGLYRMTLPLVPREDVLLYCIS